MSFKIVDRETGETMLLTQNKPKALEFAKTYLKKGNRIILIALERGVRKQVVIC